MKIKLLLFLSLSVSGLVCVASGHFQSTHSIHWTGIRVSNEADGTESHILSFENATYQPTTKNLPVYLEQITLTGSDELSSATVLSPVYELLTAEEIGIVEKENLIKSEIQVFTQTGIQRKARLGFISILPFRKNPVSGKYEKLTSFTLDISTVQGEISEKTGSRRTYADHSVLATGRWYKIGVTATGMYKLTYTDLQKIGINVSSIDPRNIRIYGNGGGMVPELNSAPRIDDLAENAILVAGEADGHFDQGDFVLFYGQSPTKWNYKPATGRFSHQVNYYSDYTYYFITTDLGPGKRIQPEASSTLPANQNVSRFQDYAVHELNQETLINSGKIWYGEVFNLKYSWDLPAFNFPDIDGNSQVYLEADFAAASTSTSTFKVFVNGGTAITTAVPPISTALNTDFAMTATGSMLFYLNTPAVNVNVTYIPQVSNSSGWLHYVEFNVVRFLNFSGSQMSFRNTACIGAGNITEFTMTNASSAMSVWDVSDPLNARQVGINVQSNNLTFRLPTDTLKEFVVFNGSGFNSIATWEQISNQDLHAVGPQDMIIITHPLFVTQANRLANVHRNEGLKVLVVDRAAIYNEFSSGAQDVSGLRDFVKMVYDKAPAGQEVKYLLMFGSGSVDYKDRLTGNNNFVPTFESLNSLSPTDTYVTDDFFGLMDDSEGNDAEGNLDIGVGRFPVRTADQASILVDKVERYLGLQSENTIGTNYANSVPRLGDWRNMVCFVADDEDGNMHIDQADLLAQMIETDSNYRKFNVDKIYFDSYVQVSTPGGQRYPDVTDAINKRVGRGALIINYTGHGGETGWAHERVLEISDIQSWANKWDMPVFVTATCEFSRFDDPLITSAGELVLLNPNGGGIALYTTTRLSFSSTNYNLNKTFYQNVFVKYNDTYQKMGEVMMHAKTPSNPNIRNFVLLGDPALGIVYPQYRVATSTINGHPVGQIPDTLKAYSHVTVTGFVMDDNGNKINNFNGIIYPTVYDKPVDITTLANDPTSYPKTFELQKNILYRGKVSVHNGDFTFSFVVPRDIAYKNGKGKISYYAQNGVTDANGYYDNFIIGGSETNFEADSLGPSVNLFLNNTDFRPGGMTDENPMLLSYVSDLHGINTVGNGIGHDIVAILDGNTDNSIVLNDYYEADLDSYQHGVIKYPFSNLSGGLHNLTIKVWDIYNNSAEAFTEFVVVSSANMQITNLLNYPNPFTDQTSFVFEHNQQGVNLNINIEIFDLSGRPVKTITQNLFTDGFKAGPITWNGCADNGQRLADGMYLYRLNVSNEQGQTFHKTSKLILLR